MTGMRGRHGGGGLGGRHLPEELLRGAVAELVHREIWGLGRLIEHEWVHSKFVINDFTKLLIIISKCWSL